MDGVCSSWYHVQYKYFPWNWRKKDGNLWPSTLKGVSYSPFVALTFSPSFTRRKDTKDAREMHRFMASFHFIIEDIFLRLCSFSSFGKGPLGQFRGQTGIVYPLNQTRGNTSFAESLSRIRSECCDNVDGTSCWERERTWNMQKGKKATRKSLEERLREAWRRGMTTKLENANLVHATSS